MADGSRNDKTALFSDGANLLRDVSILGDAR